MPVFTALLDVLDINSWFLTLDQINTKYNISANYLHYIQIKCAIYEYFKKKKHIHTVVPIPYKSPYPWNKLFFV